MTASSSSRTCPRHASSLQAGITIATRPCRAPAGEEGASARPMLCRRWFIWMREGGRDFNPRYRAFASIGERERQLPFRYHYAGHRRSDAKLHQIPHLRQLVRAEKNAFRGTRRPVELHPANSGEEEKRPLCFGVSGGRRDPGGLRERLGQNHSG